MIRLMAAIAGTVLVPTSLIAQPAPPSIAGPCLILAARQLPATDGIKLRATSILLGKDQPNASTKFYDIRMTLDLAGTEATMTRTCAVGGDGSIRLMGG